MRRKDPVTKRHQHSPEAQHVLEFSRRVVGILSAAVTTADVGLPTDSLLMAAQDILFGEIQRLHPPSRSAEPKGEPEHA